MVNEKEKDEDETETQEETTPLSTILYTSEASESRKLSEKELEISDPDFEVAKAAINANSK